MRKLIEKENKWVSCLDSSCQYMTNSCSTIPIMECLCSKSWCLKCENQHHWPSTCSQIKYFNDKLLQRKTVGESRKELTHCPNCYEIFSWESYICLSRYCEYGGIFCWRCNKKLSDMKNHDPSACYRGEKKFEFFFLENNQIDRLDDFEILCEMYENFKMFKTLNWFNEGSAIHNRWKNILLRKLPTGKEKLSEDIKPTFIINMKECYRMCLIADYILLHTLLLINVPLSTEENQLGINANLKEIKRHLSLIHFECKRMKHRFISQDFPIPLEWLNQTIRIKDLLENRLIQFVRFYQELKL